MMLILIAAVILVPAALFSFLVLANSRSGWPRILETLSLTPALGFGFATLLDFFSRYCLDRGVGVVEMGLTWGLILVPAVV